MKRHFAAALLLGFLAVLCIGDVLAADRPVEHRTIVATIGQDGVQRIDMVGGGYYYDPDHIVVTVNVPVEITIHKEKGFVPHNISMAAPEAGMEFDLELKASPTVIRFTPTQTGTFPFACTKKLLFLKSHKDKGMKGVIEVVP
jgi:plastocyanin domain-containing protein